MTENITIESFFIADYKRLKKENDELKARIHDQELEKAASTSDCGFTDLGRKTEAFRCEVASSYSAFDKEASWGKLGIEELNALSEKKTEAILEEAKAARQHWSGVVYSEEKRTFPFTVNFVTYKGGRQYAYDPDYNRTSLVEIGKEPGTGCWVNARLEADCREIAAEEIREMIHDRIDQLNNTNGDKDAD